jgi:hypothetical protein
MTGSWRERKRDGGRHPHRVVTCRQTGGIVPATHHEQEISMLEPTRKLLTRTLIATIGAAALAVTNVAPAAAETIPALSGNVIDDAKSVCFSTNTVSGVVRNIGTGANCQFSNLWFIGLPVITFNAKAATFTFKAGTAPASSTNCRIRARSRDQLVQASSSFATATVVGSWQSLSTSAITVPANGYLFADCTVPQTSELGVVTYVP